MLIRVPLTTSFPPSTALPGCSAPALGAGSRPLKSARPDPLAAAAVRKATFAVAHRGAIVPESL